MDEDPPEVEATDYGYEPDHVNEILLPRTPPEGVKPAPDDIMKRMRCGCSSAEPCKTKNCTCHNAGRACTMFCGCSADTSCCNPFKKTRNEDDGSDNDDDDDYDNEANNGNDN